MFYVYMQDELWQTILTENFILSLRKQSITKTNCHRIALQKKKTTKEKKIAEKCHIHEMSH